MAAKRALVVFLAALAIALAVYAQRGGGWKAWAAAGVMAVLAVQRLRDPGKGIDEITPPDLQCPELEASIATARATLPQFLPHVEKGVDGAFVKFALPTAGGNTEHLWGYVHFYKDGRFNVSLANRPRDPQEPADGRRDVPLGQVEDWQILQPDGRIRGAHSLIALFKYHEARGVKLTPKMRAQKASLLDA